MQDWGIAMNHFGTGEAPLANLSFGEKNRTSVPMYFSAAEYNRPYVRFRKPRYSFLISGSSS